MLLTDLSRELRDGEVIDVAREGYAQGAGNTTPQSDERVVIIAEARRFIREVARPGI
jgi:hypothetical protein